MITWAVMWGLAQMVRYRESGESINIRGEIIIAAAVFDVVIIGIIGVVVAGLLGGE